MVAAGTRELFIRGQTGVALDGSTMAGPGRRPEDAAAQADLALSNLETLLAEAGSSIDDVCKITVYIGDRAYRSAVYPVIGKHFRGIHPPVDAHCMRPNARSVRRTRDQAFRRTLSETGSGMPSACKIKELTARAEA
jgi:enamine deaminase RidA (YjgF/YER057c/UK114 family)